jgi:flavorubredoxin
MEPDHAANIENFMKAYPDTTVVANTKTFTMMENFFRGMDLEGKKHIVANGDTLTLGKHVLTFVFAPMVHWPEVMVTYDSTDKVLFSADGFGKFGALDVEEDWDFEARRYYIGIVGKYGAQVQKLLKAAATLDIQTICPLHGPILTENLGHYLEKYDIWSSHKVEYSKAFSMKKHHKRFVPPRNDGLRCIGRDKKHPCPDVDFHSERMEVHIHTYKNEYNICITLYIHRIHH